MEHEWRKKPDVTQPEQRAAFARKYFIIVSHRFPASISTQAAEITKQAKLLGLDADEVQGIEQNLLNSPVDMQITLETAIRGHERTGRDTHSLPATLPNVITSVFEYVQHIYGLPVNKLTELTSRYAQEREKGFTGGQIEGTINDMAEEMVRLENESNQ